MPRRPRLRTLIHPVRAPWRARLACVGALSLLVVSATSAAAFAAHTTFSAPGFESGPAVLGGGLLWSSELGVSLTDSVGTHLIAPGFGLPQVPVGGGWPVATDHRRGPR